MINPAQLFVGSLPDVWQNKILTELNDADLDAFAVCCKDFNKQAWKTRELKGKVKTFRVAAYQLANIDTLPEFSNLVILGDIKTHQMSQLMRTKRVHSLSSIRILAPLWIPPVKVFESLAKLTALKNLTFQGCAFQNFKLPNIQGLVFNNCIPPRDTCKFDLPNLRFVKYIHYTPPTFAQLFRRFPNIRTYVGPRPPTDLQELVGASSELVRYALGLQDERGQSLLERLCDREFSPQQLTQIKALVAREDLRTVLGPKELAMLLPVALNANEPIPNENEFTLFETLLRRGADPNHIVNGLTPLQRVLSRYLAGRLNGYYMCRLLNDLLARKANLNIAVKGGILPLFMVLGRGDEVLAIKLLTAPIPPDIRLHVEAANFFKVYHDSTKGMDSYFANCSTLSLLQAAVWARDVGSILRSSKLISLLIERGADPNQQNDLGQSLLQMAIVRDDTDLINRFYSLKGAKLFSFRDREARTALNTLVDKIQHSAQGMGFYWLHRGSYVSREELEYDLRRSTLGHRPSLNSLASEYRLVSYRLDLLIQIIGECAYKRADASFGTIELTERKKLAETISDAFHVLSKVRRFVFPEGEGPLISIKTESAFLYDPSPINWLKYLLKSGKALPHECRTEGKILDDRGFTLLHLVAEAGAASVASQIAEHRLKEFSIQAKDGRKPLGVAIDRRLAAIHDDDPKEQQEADGIIALFATIEDRQIRPLKKAKTN